MRKMLFEPCEMKHACKISQSQYKYFQKNGLTENMNRSFAFDRGSGYRALWKRILKLENRRNIDKLYWKQKSQYFGNMESQAKRQLQTVKSERLIECYMIARRLN